MNGKFCYRYKKIVHLISICLLLICSFFCNNTFAEKFNAIIKNDTEETLVISDIVKNYSRFDEDSKIENMQKLEPAQKTSCFSVNIYGYLCLEEIDKNSTSLSLDGFYFVSKNNISNIAHIVWGKIPNTGLTPIFGPFIQNTKLDNTLKVEITKEGIPQSPIYVFTIKKIDPKF